MTRQQYESQCIWNPETEEWVVARKRKVKYVKGKRDAEGKRLTVGHYEVVGEWQDVE